MKPTLEKLLARTKFRLVMIKRLNLVVARIDIDRQELWREQLQVVRVKTNVDVVKMNTKAGINQIIARLGGILHVKLFHRSDVVLVVLARHVVNLDVHKITARSRFNFAIVQAGVGKFKLRVCYSKLLRVEFGLLSDYLLDEPANRTRRSLE